ncbi:SIALI-17 repeat-containing surface protein [Streptococcus sanguinis]|uniref:DNA repair ATPase n=1 Tax=Streptococcus sanguinis SK115 TaxID=888810 RepID=F0I9X4_STRSA|nr:YSIRK signal domain/LPXTG anchor domain surface protein [Streptococcus sanguinis]EGD31608.1 DNA repair ATPase [Streptococcus sanguinis SK115]MBZ2053091.1 YSIRK signal domain/LPXTG anchor domain surface protein [Streptococcus sanguinis]
MKRTEKVLRYSIRKSVLGVGSVLICALFLGHSLVAADEEQPVANAVENPVAASPVNQDLTTVREAANKEVGAFLAEKVTDLGNNPNLSDEELAAAKDEVNQTAAKAQNEIAAAEDKERIDQAKEDGLADINSINPVGKDLLLDEIQNGKAEFDKLVDRSDLLPEEQKKSFQESVRKKAAEAEDAIQKLDVNAATAEQAEVIQEQAVTEEDKFFKFIASSTVDFTLAAKLADLEANPNLSEAEKKAVRGEIEQVVEAAKKAIEGADSQEVYDQAKETAIAHLAKIHPIGKEQFLKEIQEEKTATIEAVEKNQSLSAEEKTAAKKKIEDAADIAKKAIATYNAWVESPDDAEKIQEQVAAEKQGLLKVTTGLKLDLALSDKLADLRSNPNLSDAERATAKAEAEATLADAKTALEKADTEEELERIEEAGIASLDTIHPVGKDLVLDELEEEVDKQLEAIEHHQTLSELDKKQAKEKIRAVLKTVTDAIAQLDDSVDSAEKAEKLQEQIAAEQTKALENLEAIVKDAAKAETASSIPSDSPQEDRQEFSGGVSDSEPATATVSEYDLSSHEVGTHPDTAPQSSVQPEFSGGVSDSEPPTAIASEYDLSNHEVGTHPDTAPQASVQPEFSGNVNDSEAATATRPEFTGGVNDSEPTMTEHKTYDAGGQPSVRSAHPDSAPQISALPEFAGGVNATDAAVADALPSYQVTSGILSAVDGAKSVQEQSSLAKVTQPAQLKNKESRSGASILPHTGQASNALLTVAGVISALGAAGLSFRSRKKEE